MFIHTYNGHDNVVFYSWYIPRIAMTMSSLRISTDNGFISAYLEWPWQYHHSETIWIMDLFIHTKNGHDDVVFEDLYGSCLYTPTIAMTMAYFTVDTFLEWPWRCRILQLIHTYNGHDNVVFYSWYIPTMAMTMSSLRISMDHVYTHLQWSWQCRILQLIHT